MPELVDCGDEKSAGVDGELEQGRPVYAGGEVERDRAGEQQPDREPSQAVGTNNETRPATLQCENDAGKE